MGGEGRPRALPAWLDLALGRENYSSEDAGGRPRNRANQLRTALIRAILSGRQESHLVHGTVPWRR